VDLDNQWDNMDSKRYNRLINLPKDFNVGKIRPHIPSPTDDDYSIGYIKRFFTQRTNDSNGSVYEIDSKTFASISGNLFYTTVDLNWKIVGTDDEIKIANGKSVRYASKKLAAVSLYLPYLLQFKKSQ
jgi:hypothetical protein